MYDSSAYDAVAEMGDLEDPTAGRYKEPEFNKVLINRTRPEPCDHVITLYELNNDLEPSMYKKDAHQCERYGDYRDILKSLLKLHLSNFRPYVVLPVPSSNMILLVLDTLCPLPSSVPTLTTWPVQHDYNASLACHKVHNVELPRRRPLTCINKHANVSFALHDFSNKLITSCCLHRKV